MEAPPVAPTATDLLATGRRHLAVRDFSAAVETLTSACEMLAAEHGEAADQCAEAYLWYGKSLLGLSREESGVLGDAVPGANAEEEVDDEEENGDEQNGDGESKQNGDESVKQNGDAQPEKSNGTAEGESTKTDEDDKPASTEEGTGEKPEENGDVENGDPKDESTANLEDDDVDNLQLAWEMLDLARSIFYRRVQDGGGDAARAFLAEVHLALGEVALESETYDKAVLDMQSCLDLQKELYSSEDRRIAETHYQIGLANSLASNFEDAITHFKNAANILESRIKTLENPTSTDDATVKKHTSPLPKLTAEAEIKELKELLPEIQEKIQDMMEYKAETAKRIRQALIGGDGDSAGPAAFGSSSAAFGSSSAAFGSSSAAFGSSSAAFGSSSASFGSSSAPFSSSSAPSAGSGSSKPAADISHLIKRKRDTTEEEKDATPPPKKATT